MVSRDEVLETLQPLRQTNIIIYVLTLIVNRHFSTTTLQMFLGSGVSTSITGSISNISIIPFYLLSLIYRFFHIITFIPFCLLVFSFFFLF